jgi:hypothetical protein
MDLASGVEVGYGAIEHHREHPPLSAAKPVDVAPENLEVGQVLLDRSLSRLQGGLAAGSGLVADSGAWNRKLKS